jgi:aspartyl-tRNA(Asn)/glutamyl-tRNA(Gln) amidotransferase subunit A
MRKKIKKELQQIFSKGDFFILPTVPKRPHKLGEKLTPKEMYAYDIYTVSANLGGNPAISLPFMKVENLDVGLQIMAPERMDFALLDVAKKLGNEL